MNKADVDRALRKHLATKNQAIAIVSDHAEALRDSLLSGKPTPIVYDTKDTPPEVIKEDQVIERFPLPLSPARTTVVPVDSMFER